MKKTNLRLMIIGMLMLLAAGLAVAMKPAKRANGQAFNLDTMVPTQFDTWRIDPSIIPVKPAPDVQANLSKIYSQIVARTYVNDRGERVMLTIAYGSDQSDTLKAHRQEVCYSAQGFSINGLIHTSLGIGDKTIPVTRLVASREARMEPITYWFTMGDQVVLSRFERMMVQLRYGLLGEIPDGVLVRVSNLSSDKARAYQVHDDFVNSLLGHVGGKERGRLIGAV